MLPIEPFTTRLIAEPPPGSHVHAHLTLPPVAPDSRPHNRRQLPDGLASLLARQGIEQLSTYQWQALQRIQQQENVCVSAPAGSGRGTVRLLALHQALNHAPQRYALIICLHKQGELKHLKRIVSWNDMLSPEHHLRASIYDGDTPKTQRRKTKQTLPQVILTTPEMLHAGILAYHSGWRAFLQSLQIIVLPDLHRATGAIGVHLAHLLRRLDRLCRHYGAQPQFLTTTAPLGNLPQLTRDLSGQPCSLVTGDIRRRAPQTRIILKVSGHIGAVTDALTTRLTGAGLTPAILQPEAPSIAEPEPPLQSVICPGLPLSWIHVHEYLARLSSYAHPSLSMLLLGGQTASERYVLRYPAVYQQSWLVDVPLGFHHPLLARQHLVCAAAELALQAGERYAGLSGLSDLIKQLEREHAISRKTATRQWIATQFQPHRRIRLRFFEPPFAVIRQPDRRFITRLEPQQAFREAFAGAIYRYRDATFQVERYLADQRRIIVRPSHSTDQTRALIHAQVAQKHTHISRSAPTYRVTYGTLTYTETIRIFERRTPQGRASASRYVLPGHQRQFQTEGIWFDFDDDATLPLQAQRTARHTFMHAVFAAIRFIVACRDTAYSAILAPDDAASIPGLSAVIVDLQSGGNGISACLYQARDRLLRAALQTLLQCDCEQGCTGCIMGQRCRACHDAVGLDRQAGIRLLQKMVGDLAPSLDTIRPAAGVTPGLPPAAANASL